MNGSLPPGQTALVVHDALERLMIRRAARALHAACVPVVFFKGAALARTVYPDSWMRPRADVDAIIPRGDWEAADRVLVDAVGPRLQDAIDPRVMGQWQYRDRETGVLLDLHWRLFEAAPLRTLVDLDELLAGSIVLPGLEPVRGPGLVHALWIALLHPVAHHDGASDPVWNEDLRRVAAMLDEAGWERFAALAARTATCAICQHGLVRAGIGLPPAVEARLDVSGEPSARLLGAGRSSALSRHLGFMAGLPGWRARVAEASRLLFPPAGYMRSRYALSTRRALASAYVRRIVTGMSGNWRARSRPASDRFASDT